MRLFHVLFIAFACLTGALSQSEFDRPWEDKTRAIVIDPYQDNPIDWDKMAADDRVVGVIHRATIGLRADTMYADRRDKAIKRGYKWGSYHLGKPGDPVEQADRYLRLTTPGTDEVMALDIESLDPKTDMSLADAVRFIDHIKQKTGRYPMLYGNHSVVLEISNKYGRDNAFASAPLWYARFRPDVPDLPTSVWKTYTLWQFSSEINCKKGRPGGCLYTVPGTNPDMDINVYNGSVKDLRARWPFL